MDHHVANDYYATLDTVFASTTGAVIAFCLLSLPFMPLNLNQRWQFALVLAVATILFLIRYVWWRGRGSIDSRYYFTDIINPLMVGLLIDISNHFGLYLYFLFFLVLVSSIALLRFRHVVINASVVAIYSVYLFFISNNFELDQSERFVAGGIVFMVLGLITVFTYIIIHEIVRQLTDFEVQKLTFIQDVSHELRTPLTVIKAAAGVLQDGRWVRIGNKSKPPKEVVEHLESATADLEQITEKLSGKTKQPIKK